jgi:Pvc16 N-terminal domain
MMLYQNPVINREDISFALSSLKSANPGNDFISGIVNSGLQDQVELIKITPATLGREEMAWLWTALKADYRPTFPFQVSVVLLQPQLSTSLALPVLRRMLQAQPVQPAQIIQILPPNNQIAAAFTDSVMVTGQFLAGVTQVLLSNPRYSVQFPVPVTPVNNTSFRFISGKQTTFPAGVPAGIYNLTAQFTDPTGAVVQSTSSLPAALGPTLPTQAASTVLNADGTTTVTVTFTPDVWEGQDVSLTLSSTTPPVPPATLYTVTVPALPFAGNDNASLSFQFPAGLPSGPLLGRLTVDGVTSAITVTGSPPAYAGPMVTV